MKNKANILNILLSIIIVALVYQLTFRVNSENNMKKETTEPSDSTLIGTSPSFDNNGEKVSVGIKNYLMPQPAVVIGSYAENGQPNMMTAAWVGVCNSTPLSIAVSIRPSRMSYDNIMHNKSFTINIPSVKLIPQMDYVGVISGKDEDKFQRLGLTAIKGAFVNAPTIEEFPISIECELVDTVIMDSHTQFIGKVVNTSINPQFLNHDGSVNLEALQPVVYQENKYYTYGVPVAGAFDAYKSLIPGETPKITPKTYESATIGVIHERKSVRHFTNKQVSKAQLEALAKAGMAAPTAVNKQPWAFVAIDNRDVMNKLQEALPYASMLQTATAAMVVCGDLNKALEGDAQAYWVQDCSAATQNVLLAAESLGLGAVWTGVFPISERVQSVQKILNMPENFIPLCVIPIGYPTGEDQPKDKWKAENLIWQGWQ